MSSVNTSPLPMDGNRKRKPGKPFGINRQNNKECLKTCGMLLIVTVMKTIRNESQESELFKKMKEMIHSIFFLGYIHDDHLHPKDFFTAKSSEIHERMQHMFPEAFQQYKTHLPTRTPFSILLELMEILYETEEKIKEQLALLLKEMNFPNPLHKEGSNHEQYYTLESTVICVCYSNLNSRKYYGASLCCRKRNAKKILIDLSCLKTWHNYVSHAVMSFHDGEGDGLKFPTEMKCTAFYRDWKQNVYKEKRPCANCKKLFNLENADTDKVEHPFGNCAETECLSKLLNSDQYMQENTVINNHSELETLRYLTKQRLIEHLDRVDIKVQPN